MLQKSELSHSAYLNVALPFIVSTVTQPLLGAVDTAVVGHLESSFYIGGVAVGTVILNTIYWLFGFFRVSTTAKSAMALGTGLEADKVSSLLRPFFLAAVIGFLFILFQHLIWMAAKVIIRPEEQVAIQAHLYFRILIWGAPLVLLNYTIIGWLMGQSLVKATLFTQIFGNVLNIVLDCLFVLVFEMGVMGVAIASLISQITTFAIGLILIYKSNNINFKKHLRKALINKEELKTILSSNSDLLLRTVCVLIVFNLMARLGSKQGADVLACNSVIMQITFLISYIFDGVANASSVFTGKAIGQQNIYLLRQTLRKNVEWTSIFIAIITVIVYFFTLEIAALFTDIPEILLEIKSITSWVILFPVVAGFGLTFYGVFTGSNTTRPVRNSSIMAVLLFVGSIFWGVNHYGNNGLWLAFTLFYVGRSIFLPPYIKQVCQKIPL